MKVAQRARREAILAATNELLSTREHGQIHMREIADHSGVALATVYRYFASKELLFAHAVSAWGHSFGPMTKLQAGNARTDADRMRRAMRRTIKAYERWPTFYRLITALEITEDLDARRVFQAFSSQYQELICNVLEDTEREDAAAIAQILLSTLGAALRKWSVGEWDITQVYKHVERAVDLIFGQPRCLSSGSPAIKLQSSGQ